MPAHKQPLLLGAHISIAGGFEKAIERGESIGCTTIQIFTKSNRQWRAKPITPAAAELFKNAQKESHISSVVAHCSYLINIGAANKEIREKSLDALKQELIRCETLAIPYLVLHPGSCGSMNELECLTLITDGLDQILNEVPGNTTILLETMAGQGSNLCYRFEQIAQIRDAAQYRERLGVCFDTCHAFAAGYDFRTKETYDELWRMFDQTVGIEHIKAIHINDSKKELGARVDRHEHIGKGALGLEPFRLLFNDPKFFAIPKILETPKEGLREDLVNMHTLCDLLSAQTKNKLKIFVKPEMPSEAMRK